MMHDRAIVTMANQHEVVSISAIFSALERAPNPHFKVTPIVDVEYGINGTRLIHIFKFTIDN